MAEEFVTVAEYWAPFEAYVARAKLEDQGVRCIVEDAVMNVVLGVSMGPVKLMVPEHLVERAQEILGDQLQPPHDAEEDDAR